MINIERQPNTIYVLSLSYGKDSIATLEACKQLGYPVDAVVHSEVWFNDEISADLPPMLEFKKYADKVIKERYGLDVTHICAMKKPVAGGGVPSEEHTKIHSTNDSPAQKQSQESSTTESRDANTSTGSPTEKELGVTADSKPQPSQKLTYCDLFYTRYKHSKNPRFGGAVRIPNPHPPEVSGQTQGNDSGQILQSSRTTGASQYGGAMVYQPSQNQYNLQSMDFQSEKETGAQPSRPNIHGFPLQSKPATWCKRIKIEPKLPFRTSPRARRARK